MSEMTATSTSMTLHTTTTKNTRKAAAMEKRDARRCRKSRGGFPLVVLNEMVMEDNIKVGWHDLKCLVFEIFGLVLGPQRQRGHQNHRHAIKEDSYAI